MIEIRYVRDDDRQFWFSLDKHLPEPEFSHKVRDRRGYVLELDGAPAGLLRYNLFWDSIPFCTMLYIKPDCQGRGYGRRLMERWEGDMAAQGYGALLTSTQTDESAQGFYRKLGFRDCGGLLLDIPGYEQPMELFLIKKIGK